MKLGKAIDSYGSKLFDNPLGVVQIGFKGYDCGYTNADTILKPDLDMKDILAQQTGTKAYDHTVTGCDWMLSVTFTEIKTSLLTLIAPYLIGSSGSAGSDSGHLKADLYTSLKDTIAGALRISAVQNQLPSESIEDIMNFYIVIPKIEGDLINWGADSQRNLPVSFMIKPRQILDSESSTLNGTSVHGYWGDPTNEDLPATNYPDLSAPYAVSGVVNSATEIDITLSENATEISGVTSTEQTIVKVGGAFVVPTSIVYATNVITLTLPASSITSGDIVLVSVSAGTFEDSENNENETMTDFSVTNSL